MKNYLRILARRINQEISEAKLEQAENRDPVLKNSIITKIDALLSIIHEVDFVLFACDHGIPLIKFPLIISNIKSIIIYETNLGNDCSLLKDFIIELRNSL